MVQEDRPEPSFIYRILPGAPSSRNSRNIYSDRCIEIAINNPPKVIKIYIYIPFYTEIFVVQTLIFDDFSIIYFYLMNTFRLLPYPIH